MHETVSNDISTITEIMTTVRATTTTSMTRAAAPPQTIIFVSILIIAATWAHLMKDSGWKLSFEFLWSMFN